MAQMIDVAPNKGGGISSSSPSLLFGVISCAKSSLVSQRENGTPAELVRHKEKHVAVDEINPFKINYERLIRLRSLSNFLLQVAADISQDPIGDCSESSSYVDKEGDTTLSCLGF
jgi:hypothetical protein